jgi:alkanesulfonate monooxygenase SsuD/methylene tetrahydromethanopterin reductase-like flavin-dependent oxidoreductase (luciferase family)
VKLGLFMDLRNPAAWRRPWDEHYAVALERCEVAEAIGADAVWLTEHHFFDDGYLPQPLTFAAAIAARTRRIRIGTAVLLGALRSPVQIAEEAAVVDILSGGRMELGFGAGYREEEYRAFGTEFHGRRRQLEETLVAVRNLYATGGVSPSPVQAPLPMWLGYQGPKGARRAGELGVGLLSLDRRLLDEYVGGLSDGGHEPSAARLGGVMEIIVADDPESAAHRITPHRRAQQLSYRAAHAESVDPDVDPDADVPVTTSPEGRGLAVLTPDDAIARITAQTDGLPVEHVYFWASIAGMDDDLVDRHIELLFGTVAPAVHG